MPVFNNSFKFDGCWYPISAFVCTEGSIVPGAGTVAGAVVGGILGGLGGAAAAC